MVLSGGERRRCRGEGRRRGRSRLNRRKVISHVTIVGSDLSGSVGRSVPAIHWIRPKPACTLRPRIGRGGPVHPVHQSTPFATMESWATGLSKSDRRRRWNPMHRPAVGTRPEESHAGTTRANRMDLRSPNRLCRLRGAVPKKPPVAGPAYAGGRTRATMPIPHVTYLLYQVWLVATLREIGNAPSAGSGTTTPCRVLFVENDKKAGIMRASIGEQGIHARRRGDTAIGFEGDS